MMSLNFMSWIIFSHQLILSKPFIFWWNTTFSDSKCSLTRVSNLGQWSYEWKTNLGHRLPSLFSSYMCWCQCKPRGSVESWLPWLGSFPLHRKLVEYPPPFFFFKLLNFYTESTRELKRRQYLEILRWAGTQKLRCWVFVRLDIWIRNHSNDIYTVQVQLHSFLASIMISNGEFWKIWSHLLESLWNCKWGPQRTLKSIYGL